MAHVGQGYRPGEKPVPESVESLMLGQMFVIVDGGLVVRGMGVRHAGAVAEIGHPSRAVGALDIRPGDWQAAELDRYVTDRPGWQVLSAYVSNLT